MISFQVKWRLSILWSKLNFRDLIVFIYIVMLFKIINNVTSYISLDASKQNLLLDSKINPRHFTKNGEDPIGR
jgi:hypothetical protein